MALNLPLNEKLASSINQKRIAEEKRKQRIFNSKFRQIGIDVEALNRQVHESLLRKAIEQRNEEDFASEAIKNDKLAMILEQQKTNELREVNKKIDEYRLCVQKPEYRREFDLYDPNQKKKEHPPRLSAEDMCPISGLQKLEGEDLNYKDRCKKQKQQVRDMLLQQMQEKRLEMYKNNKMEHDWENILLQQEKSAQQLEHLEDKNCKKAIEDLKYENRLLALENKERNMQQKIQEEVEKRKDIEFNFYSPFLSEDPLSEQMNSSRVMPDRWKGMSKKQLEDIYQEQLRQIAENQRKKEQERYQNALWDQLLSNQAKQALNIYEDERIRKQNKNKNLGLINQELSQNQKLHKEYMDKVAFRNTMSNDFFSQFNTTSR